MNHISSFELSEAFHMIEGTQCCNICGEGFTRQERFEEHKLTHRIDKNYSCKICFEKFTKENQLKQHQILHINNEPFKCNICEATFARSGDLARHLRIHTVPGSTTCNNQPASTDPDKPLHNYPNRLHQRNTPCHEHISQSSATQQQQRQLEEKTFKCHICASIFFSNGNLNRHMRIHLSSSHSHHNRSHGTYHPHRHHHHHHHKHHNQHHHQHHHHRPSSVPTQGKNYQCRVCKSAFAHKTDLTRHFHCHEGMQTHQLANNNQEHGNPIAQSKTATDGKNPFNCKACWKVFTENPNTDTHARIHAVLLPFKCEVCGKAFRDTSARERHHRTHLNEKNYTCNLCHKSLSQKSSLKLHARIHTGERPFACDICGFAFARKDHLERHQQTNKGNRKLSCVSKQLQQQPSHSLQQQPPLQQHLLQWQSQIPLSQTPSDHLKPQINPEEKCPQIKAPEEQLPPSLAAQSPIASQTPELLTPMPSPKQTLMVQTQAESLSPSEQQQQQQQSQLTSEHTEMPQYLNI